MLPVLDIVIVNWNSGDQLRRCLESMNKIDTRSFNLGSVIVVDNASRDHSADSLSSDRISLRVIRNESNRGFAAACNQGARKSGADYLLFLNPDTRLLPNSLTVPISFMQEPANTTIGICGIQLLDEEGNVSRNCVRFPTPGRVLAMIFGLQRLMPHRFPQLLMVDWDHSANRDVDQVMGAFYLVRGELYRELGGFDERFFVYYEEVDFAWRAKQLGWRTHYLSTAQAFHKGQGTTKSVSEIAFFYLLRSRVLYMAKHFGSLYAFSIFVLMATVEPLTRSFAAMCESSASRLKTVLGGFWRFWLASPKILVRVVRQDASPATN